MRRIVYLLAVACLLSGCGVLTKQDLKPVPDTLTRGRFTYLADRICRRDIRHEKRAFRRRPKNHATYDKDLQALLKGYEHALFDLRGLAPPDSEAEQFRHLLAAFNFQDLLGNNLLEAGDLGQARRVKALFKKLDANDKNLKSRARALGLRACAKE
jgi:hypothetical protein